MKPAILYVFIILFPFVLHANEPVSLQQAIRLSQAEESSARFKDTFWQLSNQTTWIYQITLELVYSEFRGI